MAESSQIRHAVDGFEDYLRDFPEGEIGKWPSVERLLYMWLFDGQAIKDSGGDHRIFLSAIAIIFAEWHDAHAKGGKHVIPPAVVQARMKIGEINHGDIFDPYVFIGLKDDVSRGLAGK